MIAQDIHARLRSALAADIPVLLPEQQREPLEAAPLDAQGRPMVGGGERGLGAYLKRHPQGYVQVETPEALSGDDLLGVFGVPVAAVAPTGTAAATLARAVRRALCGLPWEPGPHREVMPAQPQEIAPGAWMVRPTYDALTIDGEHIARE